VERDVPASWSRGLSKQEAVARLAAEGPNVLPRPESRTFLRIVADILREPMFALLLGAGAVYLLLGDLKEAIILFLFACTSVGIAVVQEARTERVLESLRDLTSPRALVIRDRVEMRIAGAEVVRGDLVILAEGDRVPADATVITAHDLMTDESLLTGESAPVRKVAAPEAPPPGRPGGDDLPYVYSGSLVVRGQGRAEVTATGPRSEIGKIGVAITGIETEPPRLQAETGRLVRRFAAVSLSLSALAVLLYGFFRGGWLDAVLSGIALGMSMLPEEFPLVLTVFMVMGAWRISRAQVLTRRVSAIETLGRRYCAVHRQDRYPDAKPHDDRRIARRGQYLATRRGCRLSARPHGADPPRNYRQRARAIRSDGEGILCAGQRGIVRHRPACRARPQMGVWAAPRPAGSDKYLGNGGRRAAPRGSEGSSGSHRGPVQSP
jgi:Ca2+-transporting ATPase